MTRRPGLNRLKFHTINTIYSVEKLGELPTWGLIGVEPIGVEVSSLCVEQMHCASLPFITIFCLLTY